MSELPFRPDLDQLRRQARELLRAAVDGDQQALARLRAYSERVTLSAAQFALAREHGYPSWARLRAEVERRRVMAAQTAAQGTYWSLGGAGAVMTAAGMLSPTVLLVGPDRAILEATLAPSAGTMTATGPDPAFDDLTVTDDRGMRYSIETAMSGPSEDPGVTRTVALSLRVQPVPAPGCGWLDLRNQDGAACRLLRSARAGVQVGPVAPAAGTAVERELTRLALSVIELELGQPRPASARSGRCSMVLARIEQLHQSGDLDPDSELPKLIAGLCDVLTGGGDPAGLPAGWSAMLDAAHLADGPRYNLDIPVALPPLDGLSLNGASLYGPAPHGPVLNGPALNSTAVQLRTLVSEPGSWRVWFTARPGWWVYSDDHRRKWAALRVQAEDDRGGMYIDSFGGSIGHPGHEEAALRFRPRLDPLARELTLTWAGSGEQVAVKLDLRQESTH